MKRKADVEQQKKSKKNKKSEHLIGAKSLISLGLPYLVFSLLIICLVAILQYYFMIEKSGTTQKQAFVKETLNSYVSVISSSIKTFDFFVEHYTRNENFINAIVDNNTQDIEHFENLIKSSIPEAHGAKVVFPDVLAEDLSASPAISNTILELVRQLIKGQTILPELILPGSKNQYIASLHPIKKNDTIIAVLVVGMNANTLKNVLKTFDALPGYMEAWQSFNHTQQVIASYGDKKFKRGQPFSISNNNNSKWQIAFWPQQKAELSGQNEMFYFIAGLIIILIVVAMGNYVGLNIIRNTVKSDTGALAKAFLDSQEMSLKTAKLFKLNYFRDFIMTLSQNNYDLSFNIPPQKEVIQDPSPSSPKKKEKPKSQKESILPKPETEDIFEEIQTTPIKVPDSIFRAYDIRGVVNETLNEEIVRTIGQSIGSEAYDRGEQKVIVARDGRLSGPSLLAALKQGIKDSGRDVIDIGVVPTPVLYFAAHYLDTQSGVMLTGSHNPANYNGLKIVIAGETLSQDSIQALKERINNNQLLEGQGSEEEKDILPDYLNQITSDIALAQPLKVVVDCGNGVAGVIAPTLVKTLGCEVIELFCDVDGNFPNHHPDPSKPDNLKDLINAVKNENADIGLAFDGDGDRLGVVDSNGSIIWPDRQMMLYSMDVLSRNPGADIIFDVKCTSHLPKIISGHGGRPVMWKTGHSLIKSKMKEINALLAGECSGHVFFKERWYGFDDAIYTAARLMEILAGDSRTSSEIFAALPDSETTPEINVSISDTLKFEFIKKFSEHGYFPNGKLNTIDGVRVDYDDGWGLVRASNTTPCLVVRFEAETKERLDQIQDTFREQMLAIDNSLHLPF